MGHLGCRAALHDGRRLDVRVAQTGRAHSARRARRRGAVRVRADHEHRRARLLGAERAADADAHRAPRGGRRRAAEPRGVRRARARAVQVSVPGARGRARRARASADDLAKQLEREAETRRALADEVRSGRRELAERTKQAAKDAAAGVDAARAELSASTRASTSRDVPLGREFSPHAVGVSGEARTTTLDFQVLSWEPHAVLYRNFASLRECEHVKGLAASRLAPSGLALRRGEKPEETKDIRTSSGTFLSRKQDPAGVLLALEKRIADATHVRHEHGEPFNVLRYTPGQKYDSHYDTFDPESYGPQTSQRIASFLLYLTDVEAGGETHFPLEGPGGLERLKNIDYASCEGGLRVRPRAGTRCCSGTCTRTAPSTSTRCTAGARSRRGRSGSPRSGSGTRASREGSANGARIRAKRRVSNRRARVFVRSILARRITGDTCRLISIG